MSQLGLADAAALYEKFVRPALPWLPAPVFRDVRPDGTKQPEGIWNYAYEWAWGEHVIYCPYNWDFNYDYVIAHEAGHYVAQWVYMARGTQWPDMYSEWLAWMGADLSLRQHKQMNEIWAEHLRDMLFPGSPTYYPALQGLVPYNRPRHRAFIDSIAIEEDGLKFISGDLAVATDSQGNANVVINPTGLRQGIPAFGSAQRIGATAANDLPDAVTYQVDTTGPVAIGRLLVKGDIVKNGTAYFRVMAMQ